MNKHICPIPPKSKNKKEGDRWTCPTCELRYVLESYGIRGKLQWRCEVTGRTIKN